jgi:CO/xanthine dehydrogenase Mo-binding subunit
LLDYAIPTAVDVPHVRTVMVEETCKLGPYGAKGVGEPPIIPGAAAIANAVHDAIGVRVSELPITPERVVAALHKQSDKRREKGD